jgi:hypothetical protein
VLTRKTRLRRQRRGTRKARIPRFVVVGMALGLTLGRPVFAQEHGQNRAAAETLFKDAITLMEAGNDVKACPKLEESQKLDPAPGTLMYLGECYDRIGRVASAWAAFNSAASAAAAARQSGRVTTANQRAKQIAPKVPKLAIVVPADAMAAGLTITRDGTQVGEAGFGASVAVDPGEHVIEATAPGRRTWSHSITAAPNGETTTVTVPTLAVAPTAEGGEGGSGVHGPSIGPGAGTPTPEGSADSSVLVAGAVVGGVGLAGLVVAAITGGVLASKKSDIDAACPDKVCSAEGRDLIDSTAPLDVVNGISWGVGLAGLAVGAILIAVGAGSDASEEQAPAVRAFALPGGAGLGFATPF